MGIPFLTLLIPGRHHHRLLIGWIIGLLLAAHVGLRLAWFWPFTFLILLHSLSPTFPKTRRFIFPLITLFSPIVALLWFPMEFVLSRKLMKVPAIIWMFFFLPLYRVFSMLHRLPSSPVAPGLIAILTLVFLTWLLLRNDLSRKTVSVIASVTTATILTFFPNILNAIWTPVVWCLVLVLLIADVWLDLVFLPAGWRRATAWLNFLIPAMVLVCLGFWVRTGWSYAYCDQPNVFVEGRHIRVQHFFPVSALPETRWPPGLPRVWSSGDGCYETMNLDGQLMTMVWKLQRKIECRQPMTWQLTIADALSSQVIERYTLPLCLWATTHPSYLTLSHLVPGIAVDDHFARKRIRICTLVPQYGGLKTLDLQLVTVQRSLPLLYAQNIRVLRWGPRRFNISVRLMNNRRSVLQGTFLAGLIRPTTAPPFHWIAVRTMTTSIPAGQALDINWVIESRPWCGNATWGMAFYESDGERGYLWNGIL